MELLDEQQLRAIYHRVPGLNVGFSDWLQLRDRSRRDLWFLTKDVHGKALVEFTHRPVTDFFLAKDNSKPFAEQGQYDVGLLLYPRRSFKSTIDVADVSQWIINWPLVRCMILTETDELAESFIGELRDYFVIQNPEKPTLFQQLFPEFCSPPERSAGDKFVSPARALYFDAYCRYYKAQGHKEKLNAWAASLGANPPGFGCDVLKVDDAITPRNSRKDEQRQKAIQGYDEAAILVDSGGHVDIIGTRYHPKELYARVIERAAKSPTRFRILSRPAWWLKPGSVGKNPDELGKDDYELLFERDSTGKKRLTYGFLCEKRDDNPSLFASQYLNDPQLANACPFVREQIVAHTIPWAKIPKELTYYIAWDFAYSVGGDYTVGVVGGVDSQGRLFILEVMRARYLPQELAFKIVDSFVRWNPRLIIIENSNGANLLSPAIDYEARVRHLETLPIHMEKIDRAADAKYMRVSPMQALVETDRLWFADTITCLPAMYDEFEAFTGEKGNRDDIVDAMSYLQPYLPSASQQSTTQSYVEAMQALKRKKLQALIFDESFGAPVAEPPITEYDEPQNYFGASL